MAGQAYMPTWPLGPCSRWMEGSDGLWPSYPSRPRGTRWPGKTEEKGGRARAHRREAGVGGSWAGWQRAEAVQGWAWRWLGPPPLLLPVSSSPQQPSGVT
jgi:hypothetical protein